MAHEIDRRTAQLIDGKSLAAQSTRRRGAKRHDERRPDEVDFGLEPPAAGLNLAAVGPLMQALLAARLEFEMLDRIGDIGLAAIDAGIGQGAVEDFSRRPDKGLALEIFLVTRLLADKDDRRLGGTFAKDGLGGVFIELAAPAVVGLGAQLREGASLRAWLFGNFHHDMITPSAAF